MGGLSRTMLRAEIREILRAGRLQLARGADAIGRVAGQHLINRGRVIEQAVGRVADRTDQRELVRDLGQFRHQFRDLHAGQSGVDRIEDASDVIGDVRLGVPQVEMAGAALQEDHDHALGLAPPRVHHRLPLRQRSHSADGGASRPTTGPTSTSHRLAVIRDESLRRTCPCRPVRELPASSAPRVVWLRWGASMAHETKSALPSHAQLVWRGKRSIRRRKALSTTEQCETQPEKRLAAILRRSLRPCRIALLPKGF